MEKSLSEYEEGNQRKKIREKHKVAFFLVILYSQYEEKRLSGQSHWEWGASVGVGGLKGREITLIGQGFGRRGRRGWWKPLRLICH